MAKTETSSKSVHGNFGRSSTDARCYSLHSKAYQVRYKTSREQNDARRSGQIFNHQSSYIISEEHILPKVIRVAK